MPGGDLWLGWFIAAPSLVLALIAEGRAFAMRRKQRSIEIHDDGFLVSRGDDRHSYHDRDVDALAYACYPHLNNGTVCGTRRRFRVWLSGETRPLIMENFLSTGMADPLAGLIQRLIKSAVTRAQRRLAGGGMLTGSGWRLDGTTFYPGRSAPIALADLAAVDECDDRICLWLRGAKKAAFRTRCDGRNAAILFHVLEAKLLERPSGNQYDATNDGLGRILFARRVGFVVPLVLLGFAILVGVLGCFSSDPLVFFILAPVLGVVGCCLLLGQAQTFYCHEGGVSFRSMLSQGALRFIDVASLTYAATQRFRKGVYESTKLLMVFSPRPGSGGAIVEFAIVVRGVDAELDKLRDFVAGIIACNMNEQLAAEGAVAWAASLTFLAHGLEHYPAGLLGRKDATFIPYSSCRHLQITDGVLKIFDLRSDKPLFSLKTSEENFFPGYLVLRRLISLA
ncbi:MAG TPA: hypothetical protein VJ783_11110 [Pirellulales bacterium]|nr:hypothetical protein [Pirellulales bacterium]